MGLGFNLYGGDHSGGRQEREPIRPVSPVDTNSAFPLAIAEAFQRAAAFQNFTARLERGTDHGSGVVAVTILAWNQPGAKIEIVG